MIRSGRGMALALAVAAVGAFAAVQALAATTEWKGHGKVDDKVTVTFDKAVGEHPKTKSFLVTRLKYRCNDPHRSTFRSSVRLPTRAIHQGKFSFQGSANQGGITYTASGSGEFTSGSKAEGTIRETRKDGGSSLQCTGRSDWTAHKR